MTAPFPPVGYGPPPPGYGPPAYGRPRVPRRGNPVGIIGAIVGGAVALIGTLVSWYEPDAKLSDLVQALDATEDYAYPRAYLGWLMWVILAVTVVLALSANVAWPPATACRIVSPIMGVFGAGLLIVSLNQLVQEGSVFDHAQAGLWLVLLGFVVAGASGILGPRRISQPYGPQPYGPPANAAPPYGPRP